MIFFFFFKFSFNATLSLWYPSYLSWVVISTVFMNNLLNILGFCCIFLSHFFYLHFSLYFSSLIFNDSNNDEDDSLDNNSSSNLLIKFDFQIIPNLMVHPVTFLNADRSLSKIVRRKSSKMKSHWGSIDKNIFNFLTAFDC